MIKPKRIKTYKHTLLLPLGIYSGNYALNESFTVCLVIFILSASRFPCFGQSLNSIQLGFNVHIYTKLL